MKTTTIRTGRRILGVLLALALPLFLAMLPTKAAEVFHFTLMPSSEQFRKEYVTGDQLGRRNTILNKQSGHTIYLACNEREGLQAVYCETALASRSIRLKVSDFTHQDGSKMKPLLYREEYMEPEDWRAQGIEGRNCADALVPYKFSDQPVTAEKDVFVPFYIEVISAKDSTPGEYTAEVSIVDADTGVVLVSQEAKATVWDFALPEGHYSDTAFGAYDGGGTYGDRNWFLRLNDAGWVEGGDNTAAKAVIKGWYDFLLDHGINAYELPRDLIVDDPRLVQEYLSNPRVNSVVVPFAQLQEYKDLASGNDLWKSKLYAYPYDEPDFSNPVRVAALKANIERYRDIWPEIPVVVPFGGDMTYAEPVIRDTNIDVLCPNQSVYGSSKASYDAMKALGDAWKAKGGRVWTYPCGWHYATVHFYSWEVYSTGPQRRAFFWQQYHMGFNGLLYWETGYWRATDGTPHNPWVNNTLPAKSGVAQNNGDGQLVYPAGPLGLDPTVPIASLRLKQIADGVDDFDYLTLAEEFLGRDFALQALASTNTLNFDPVNPHAMFINGSFGTSPGYTLVIENVEKMRKMIAEALEKVNTEHDWGPWETVLPPTAEREGLDLRTCQTCGTQESREIPKLVTVTGVTLNANAQTINAGSTFQLAATVAPANADNKAVTWSSSDTAVATVDASGLVTAKAEGTATITVTTVEGGKTAQCVITVPHVPVPVTGVTLNANAQIINAGSTFQLTETVAPANADNKAVTWSSSDTAVATVDANGLVTAKAEGTASIMVTTVDGGKTAQCVITVEMPQLLQPPAITSANNKTVDSDTGGTFQVTATGAAPITFGLTGAPSGVTINFSTGLITIAGSVAQGTYPFTVTASNGVGSDAAQSFTLTVNNSGGGTTTKKYIFATKYEPTFWNWLMFIFLFGWIWM